MDKLYLKEDLNDFERVGDLARGKYIITGPFRIPRIIKI